MKPVLPSTGGPVAHPARPISRMEVAAGTTALICLVAGGFFGNALLFSVGLLGLGGLIKYRTHIYARAAIVPRPRETFVPRLGRSVSHVLSRFSTILLFAGVIGVGGYIAYRMRLREKIVAMAKEKFPILRCGSSISCHVTQLFFHGRSAPAVQSSPIVVREPSEISFLRPTLPPAEPTFVPQGPSIVPPPTAQGRDPVGSRPSFLSSFGSGRVNPPPTPTFVAQGPSIVPSPTAQGRDPIGSRPSFLSSFGSGRSNPPPAPTFVPQGPSIVPSPTAQGRDPVGSRPSFLSSFGSGRVNPPPAPTFVPQGPSIVPSPTSLRRDPVGGGHQSVSSRGSASALPSGTGSTTSNGGVSSNIPAPTSRGREPVGKRK